MISASFSKSLRSIAFLGLLTSLVLTNIPSAQAHDLSYAALRTNLEVSGATIHFTTQIPETLSATLAPGETSEGVFSGYYNGNFVISIDGQPCSASVTLVDTTSVPKQSTYKGDIACPKEIKKIGDFTLTSTIFSDAFSKFDHYVTVSLGKQKWEIVFSADKFNYPKDVRARNVSNFFLSFLDVAKRFTWLGAQHIFTGYDHILFLLSVILLLRSFKKIMVLVSSFTIAHSITLILAGLGIITLSPKIVEPLIALSIAYMAIRNLISLYKKQEQNNLTERWWATFGFGLIHGLGFAGALSATTIPQQFFVPSLIVFNVGVELGQISILLVVVPWLFMADGLRHKNRLLMVISGAIALLALIWFVQRLIVR